MRQTGHVDAGGRAAFEVFQRADIVVDGSCLTTDAQAVRAQVDGTTVEAGERSECGWCVGGEAIGRAGRVLQTILDLRFRQSLTHGGEYGVADGLIRHETAQRDGVVLIVRSERVGADGRGRDLT